MSPDEIAICLGLQEPRYFAIEKMRHYASEAFVIEHGVDHALHVIAAKKGTGRTTWMLCEVLSAVSCGKTVFITAHNGFYAKALRNIASGWAKIIGLNPDLVMTMEHEAAMVFEDHYIPEHSGFRHRK